MLPTASVASSLRMTSKAWFGDSWQEQLEALTKGWKEMKMNKKTEALNALANIRDFIRNNEVRIPSPVAKDFNIVAGRLGSMHGEYDRWCIPDEEKAMDSGHKTLDKIGKPCKVINGVHVLVPEELKIRL